MEFFQPVNRAADKKIAHFVAAIIEYQGAPVGVFIQGAAIEVGQAMGVLGEVRRDPVQIDTDVVLMAIVDKKPEVIR